MARSTCHPRSRRCRPLSTRRCARAPLMVWALSLHTPSQWMRAHCRGQYTKCSMAEIGTTGSAFTTVRLQTPASCPPSLWVRTGHSATPRGRPLAAKWPWFRGSTRPGARRCRRCRGAGAMQASGRGAVDSPESSASLSAARPHRRSGPPAGRLPGHVQAGWQDRRNASSSRTGIDPDRRHVRQRTQSGLIKSQSVVFHSDGLTGQRSPNPCYRRFHLFVELHQPMVQPLDRPRAGGIERSMRDLAVLIDTQIGHRRRQRPGIGVTPRRACSRNERLHGNLSPHLAGSLPLFGNRQVGQ